MIQQYLIFYRNEVVLTKWFSIENHYMEGAIVVDTLNNCYYDGNEELIWKDIITDHL